MSSYTTHLSTLLALVLIVEFSIGAPLIAESQKRPTDREFGQRDTIHLYPTDVASTDWRSLDNVLIPDNDEDDIYQQFSKREAAYVPLPAELEAEAEADAAAEQNQAIESSTNENTEPSDSLDAIDESSNTEPASDSTDVEVVPPPQPEPEEQSEPVAEPVNTSPSETEDSSAKESTTAEPTAMLDRAKESMSSFFTVARELFPLAQSGTTTLRSES